MRRAFDPQPVRAVDLQPEGARGDSVERSTAGRLEIETRPGAGTTIVAEVPFG